MIIDGHMHCPDRSKVKTLLKTYDKVGIEKGAVLATPSIYGHGDNNAFERTVREHPDRFVGLGFVDLLDALHLDEATRRKLLADNARAFYRIEPIP